MQWKQDFTPIADNLALSAVVALVPILLFFFGRWRLKE